MLNIIQKYRHFLWPLLLVVILDLTLLAMNFAISAQLEAASTEINLAGRQRMLTQRISKAVMQLHYQQENGGIEQATLDELSDAGWLFEQTLRAFENGGTAIDGSGQQMQLSSQQNRDVQSTLQQAQQHWQPLHLQLQLLLEDIDVLPATIEQLADSNLVLLDLMNQLTSQMEKHARQQTYLLRGLQSIIVILILLSFTLAVHRLVRRDQYFSGLMEKSSDIVIGIGTRHADINFISASVKSLLNHDETYYMGHHISRLFDKDSCEQIQSLLQQVKVDGQLPENRIEVHLLKADGKQVIAEMLLQTSISEDGRFTEISGDIRDISERKQLEVTLTEMAHTDTLTGLPNRSQFQHIAEREISAPDAQNAGLALMFIDLDDFKAVNDQYGHNIGDQLLVEVAIRITADLRALDTVCRFGGDEFVVWFSHIRSDEHLQKIGEKIIGSLSQPIHIEGCVCHIGASIGVARFPIDGNDPEAMLRAADQAMYQVKYQGKNAVAFAS